MSRPVACLLAALAGLAGPAALPAAAATYTYPGAGYATLQDAITHAEGSADAVNYLNLGVAPITTAAEVVLDNSFNAGRQLIIRPDPALGLARTAIVSQNGTQAIFRIAHAGYVTFQDLDILRNSTNANHLMIVDFADHVTIERCRIGSTWSSVGSAGWSNLHILYPTDIVVRNCILFSRVLGNFARGVYADGFTDPNNSLFLYNNDVADYGTYGIHINCTMAGVTVVLRNNVVINHPGATVEPTAYRSGVGPDVTLVTDGNTAFATAANVETFIAAGMASIAGPAPGRLRLERAQVGACFVTWAWNATPPWHANPTFYRLLDFGPLHQDGFVHGVTVANGAPDPNDIAVADDIERDARPGGSPLHTDRGADQIEDGALTLAPDPAPSTSGLSVVRGGDPARGTVAFRAETAGRLLCELFDIAGRRVWREERTVVAGEVGAVAWPPGHASGMLLYRLTLTGNDGARRWTSGKLVLAR